MSYDNPHRDLACGVSELEKRGCESEGEQG
jgi:hypothetical protein